MTTIHPASTAAPGRARNITLWVVQVLMAIFFIVAASGPKLFGAKTAVDMFTQIGAGQWLRYFVGACEFAGGIGLLVKPLSGLAAIGLTLLMIGATITQIALAGGALIATPATLAVVFALVAWGRRAETTALFNR